MAGAPFVIFFGKADTPTACAAACVADAACTGFVRYKTLPLSAVPLLFVFKTVPFLAVCLLKVHTDDKTGHHEYDNTCYFRTDGCHATSCDKLIRVRASSFHISHSQLGSCPATQRHRSSFCRATLPAPVIMCHIVDAANVDFPPGNVPDHLGPAPPCHTLIGGRAPRERVSLLRRHPHWDLPQPA